MNPLLVVLVAVGIGAFLYSRAEKAANLNAAQNFLNGNVNGGTKSCSGGDCSYVPVTASGSPFDTPASAVDDAATSVVITRPVSSGGSGTPATATQGAASSGPGSAIGTPSDPSGGGLEGEPPLLIP